MICLPACWPSRLPPADTFSTASTTEIELLAAAKAITEGLRLRKLLTSLGKPLKPILIPCDNRTAVFILKNPITVNSKRFNASTLPGSW